VKQSLHDLHNYSETQCNFKRRDTVIPTTTLTTTSTTQQLDKSSNRSEKEQTQPKKDATVTEEKKKPGKETQVADFFGSKASTSTCMIFEFQYTVELMQFELIRTLNKS